MANIFSRSPYIITIDEALQVSASIHLYLWQGPGSIPLTPQYKFTKAITSNNDTRIFFDIAPYINEYLSFNDTNDISSPSNTPSNSWLNINVKTYSNDVFYDSLDFKGFYGYTEFMDGYNYDNGNLLIDDGTYYYYSSASNKGNITYYNDLTGSEASISRIARYTDVVTNDSHDVTLTNNKIVDIPCVYYSTNGNKLEIVEYNSESESFTTLYTLYYYPKSECKYTPVKCDFVNKYGAWQRTWFYKNSQDNFEVDSKSYDLMVNNSYYPDYLVKAGQKKVFNNNGKETIKVNTDWVEENYKEVIKQLMMSERIMLDDKAVILNTKSVELFKHITTKQINYSLDFTFAYNFANNVI